MKWFLSLAAFFLFFPGHSDATAQSSLWTLDLPDPTVPDQARKRRGREEQEGSPALSWEEYFRKNRNLKKMNLGIRLEGSQPLGRNDSEPMVPASLQKIFTAASALRYLGPGYRFENSFSGDFDQATFTLFNPVFRISGDPTWGHEAFEGGLESTDENLKVRLNRVIRTLKNSMTQRVQGPILIESSRPMLSTVSRPAGWRESWSLECMAVLQTEFQANGNCGQFKIVSTTRYGWVTEGVSVPVRMKLLKSKEGSNSIRVLPVYDVRGRIREYVISGYFTRGPVVLDLPVHQSKGWLENLFVKMLEAEGIEYSEGPREAIGSSRTDALQEKTRIEVDVSSRSLLEILQQAVRFSINGVMDRIFLEVGYRLGAYQKSEIAQGKWMEDAIREIVGDESLMTGIRMEDGSGLNLFNRIRPDLLYTYLNRLKNEPYFRDFFSTLAIAGKSGTLLNRSVLVSSGYTYGRIYAKTGTLNGVTNLAGYFVEGPGATPEPFVILSDSEFSSAAARALIDGIVVNFAAHNSASAQN
jgi:D-alanyl-D-alanine carboxypeptidase/D-alanyl-D-alanine-endopeptidase (penicillin-binding protein 4)